APDDATIRGARTAEAALTDLARTQNWEQVREELAWITWKGGTGLLCLDWDASAGKYVGQSATADTLGTGELTTTALSVVEHAAEAGTSDIERACWWVKAGGLPPAEVQKLYGLKNDPRSDANAALSPLQAKLLSVGREDNTPPQALTLVLTYYE